MILCVTPNIAVDKTLLVENFRLNAIHRPSKELSLPGGKGINVARAARTLGQNPVVTGWVGGHAGNFIEDMLHAEGIESAFVRASVETRECISILDPLTGAITEIYEKGRPVSPSELEAFYTLFARRLAGAAMVTLSGSLPPGVPADFFARLIGMAREARVLVALDSSGEPLRLGLEARPDLLKCNRSELSGAIGKPLDSLDDLRETVQEISARVGMRVVITLGGSGAVAADGARAWLAQAPRVQAVSAVGSGDAFLAGLACGLLDSLPFEQALRLAVAAGAANTLQVGAGRLLREDVNRLLEQTAVAESR